MLPMTSSNPLGDAVREARLARGWTQDDLARKADVTSRTVSSFENGKSSQSRTRKRLAKALGCRSLEDLLVDTSIQAEAAQ